MTTEADLPIEQRIVRLLQRLGIEKAHIAAQLPGDWTSLAVDNPDAFASLTLLCPLAGDANVLAGLADRLLVVSGDQGRGEVVIAGTKALSGATLVTLPGHHGHLRSDDAAYDPETVADSILGFLARFDNVAAIAPSVEHGEAEGLTYRIQGKGAPLVLLPLGLAESQWEPVISRLSERYCTITVGGPNIGFIGTLEARARSAGHQQMLSSLIDEANISTTDSVLEAGCRSGVLSRLLASRLAPGQRVVAVESNAFFVEQAAELTKRQGLDGLVEFRHARTEELPFPDSSFDVVFAPVVFEEGDAEKMLSEILRVTKSGGRVGAIVRATDVPYVINVPLRPELKAKIEAPVTSVGDWSIGDASLYSRLAEMGLTGLKKFPQFVTYQATTGPMRQFLQGLVGSKLSADEMKEWNVAADTAVADGTFFYAWPHHCAVGTKP